MSDVPPDAPSAPPQPPADADSTPTLEQLAKQVAALQKTLGEMDPRLTGRINAAHTAVATAKAELSKRLGGVETDLSTATTAIANNTASVNSFGTRLDTLTHKAEDAATAAATLTRRLDTVEGWQSAINSALLDGVQEAKDFALEQGQSARAHTDTTAAQLRKEADQARTDLTNRIDAVAGAPVKPHKHVVHLAVDGQTSDPALAAGGRA